jgi:indolepyruvate ferredoxin oxidoreductase
VTASFPGTDQTIDRIAAATRPAGSVYVDARALAEEIFGDDQYANMLLVGASYQAGALPIPAEAIEAAIRLNGVAVETNLQAFRRGRQYVADASALSRELRGEVDRPTEEFDTELERLVALRTEELTAYQSGRYATAYTEFVERVREAEETAVPGSTALSEAVARNLHKLMAYKDEYEVARLARGSEVRDLVTGQFGEGAKASWKLHPPTLKALGMKQKLTLGPWFGIVLALLARMKFLRGTPLDPFGRAEVRRVERRLVAEYRVAVEEVLGLLSAQTLPASVELAGLPDRVRGYEDVKLANVASYDVALAEHLTLIRTGG